MWFVMLTYLAVVKYQSRTRCASGRTGLVTHEILQLQSKTCFFAAFFVYLFPQFLNLHLPSLFEMQIFHSFKVDKYANLKSKIFSQDGKKETKVRLYFSRQFDD